MRSDKPHVKTATKRVALGWKILGATFVLWAVGLFLNPITFQMSLGAGMMIRLKVVLAVAIVQLLLAIAGAVLVLPAAHRGAVRISAIVLVVALVAMTSLFHVTWAARLLR